MPKIRFRTELKFLILIPPAPVVLLLDDDRTLLIELIAIDSFSNVCDDAVLSAVVVDPKQVQTRSLFCVCCVCCVCFDG